MNSNDSGNANAINANTTGYIADIKTDIYNIEFGGYFASLTLDDYDSSTKDGVSSYMVYVKNFGKYSLGARYSSVSPEDYDGNGEGITSALMPLGLSNITITDLDVSRIQVAGICIYRNRSTFIMKWFSICMPMIMMGTTILDSFHTHH